MAQNDSPVASWLRQQEHEVYDPDLSVVEATQPDDDEDCVCISGTQGHVISFVHCMSMVYFGPPLLDDFLARGTLRCFNGEPTVVLQHMAALGIVYDPNLGGIKVPGCDEVFKTLWEVKAWFLPFVPQAATNADERARYERMAEEGASRIDALHAALCDMRRRKRIESEIMQLSHSIAEVAERHASDRKRARIDDDEILELAGRLARVATQVETISR